MPVTNGARTFVLKVNYHWKSIMEAAEEQHFSIAIVSVITLAQRPFSSQDKC